ncbi:MAG: alpha-1,4-glucan--maltose-1-phosphate maltosyltransferase [Deltaproteobacteria bacterium]|nr:alpha-1,4-glucan--maltose-1-phosphate maltosyltransferase [Deltaproteobacteria bacterium]
MLNHILIENVAPSVDCGQYPVKRIVGEPVVVEADVFRDGHYKLRAVVKWRRKEAQAFRETAMEELPNDRFRAVLVPAESGRYLFTVEAWTDRFASWLGDFRRRVAAGRPAHFDLEEGIALLEEIVRNARGSERSLLAGRLDEMRRSGDPAAVVALLDDPVVGEAAARAAGRPDACAAPLLELVADRPLARFGAWYELFVRSQGTEPGRPASFREAERRLGQIRDMGFDVLYLAPIHPIGVTSRKGPNNVPAGGTESPGSPWAIGNASGGHTAVDPALGTLDDFDHFVAAAANLGLEVALDFAVQCSPDHPWVSEHPEWFARRLDGSVKYAENPPKEYQDVYPIDFNTADQAGLMEELLRVVLFWVGHGVRLFRVDNPHTKPVPFWRWLIDRVQEQYPDVLFLAEAFTRPKMMKALAKAGFSQSYTYFTWRNTKAELIEYLSELTASPLCDYFRPNFFTNTPDILSEVLQTGGRPAFKMRLVLAATLSPSYGIYSGYELCENAAVPGTEEYADSEKYQVKVRDWNRPGNINEFIARVNAVRRDNPALHELTNLRFLATDSDRIICYCKATADLSNVLLVAVNLDPHNPRECSVVVPSEAVGVAPGQSYRVTDLLTGMTYTWAERNYLRLDPQIEPAHILKVRR